MIRLLYFALTGSSPRDANHAPASALVAGVPEALDDVLVRALDAEPARRPSADDFERALAGCGRWSGGWRFDAPPPEPDADLNFDPDAPATVAER